MPEIVFDRFYRYEQLAQILHAFAEEYPHLVRVESEARVTKDVTSGW